jgi:hypothetical protein
MMRYAAMLVLGIVLGLCGWWLVAHWGMFAWWTWLAIGFVSGAVVGACIMWIAMNIAIRDEIGGAFGW